MKRRLLMAGAALGGLIVLLVLSELGLRLWWPASWGGYYVLAPSIHTIYHIKPRAMEGVSGDSHYWTNSDGLRGDAYDPDPAVYHILTFGGSTTECVHLDQGGSWPEMLRKSLIAADRTGTAVWVGNGGRSGQRSWESQTAMLYLLPHLPDVDMVILMPGANDLYTLLRTGEEAQVKADYLHQPVPREVLSQTFLQWPDPQSGGLFLLRLIAPHSPADGRDAAPFEAVGGDQLRDLRQRRKHAAVYIDTLPDMQTALETYRFNLEQIVDTAEEHHVKLVLVTQPAIYTNEMPEDVEARLWNGAAISGEDGSLAYFTPGVMRRAFEMANKVLQSVCDERHVVCVDAASALNGNYAIFYDDVHMNYEGTGMLAGIIAKQILASQLFP